MTGHINQPWFLPSTQSPYPFLWLAGLLALLCCGSCWVCVQHAPGRRQAHHTAHHHHTGRQAGHEVTQLLLCTAQRAHPAGLRWQASLPDDSNLHINAATYTPSYSGGLARCDCRVAGAGEGHCTEGGYMQPAHPRDKLDGLKPAIQIRKAPLPVPVHSTPQNPPQKHPDISLPASPACLQASQSAAASVQSPPAACHPSAPPAWVCAGTPPRLCWQRRDH